MDKVRSVNLCVASGWLQNSSNHVENCGLSSTIVPKKAENFIFFDRKRQIVDCLEVSELLSQTLQLDRILKDLNL